MKKAKKIVCMLLIVFVCLSSSPLQGFVGMELPNFLDVFTTKASAVIGVYYTYTVSDEEATITDCDSSISGDIVIPDTLGGYPVTNIGDFAFKYCTGLTSITIPDSVTSIGYSVFEYCTSLTRITIPDSVINIGDYAFSGCTSLKKIRISNNITSISKYAFRGCSSLTNITLPDGVTSIGEYAFRGCTNLTSITIPVAVTSVGNGAFYECTSLPFVRIPDGVKYIDRSVFANCTGLTSVTIPDSVISIGNYAFQNCSSLSSITIPDSVTSIGYNAFYGCTGLTSVNISDLASWCNIDFLTFDSNPLCYAKELKINGDLVTDIVIPNEVISIGDWTFDGYASLTSIAMPDSVTSIGVGAFSNCTGLTQITLPNSVRSIGEYAFRGCSNLTNITIPDSLISIKANAFNNCTSLKDVYYGGAEVQWNAVEIGEGNDPLCNATMHFTHTHTSGEWVTVQEPTITAEGKKVIRCTVCGEIIEEAAIPMLQVVSDKGIDLAFPADDYDGEVDVTVEESFDGTAFDIIDTSANTSKKVIYDIKMTLNGEEIQPNGKVTIRIPLPTGYDPTRSFVYHVNTVTGKVEKIDARYEDSYLVFETEHIGYYAVVEVAEASSSVTCQCNCHKSGIVKFFFNIILFFQRIFKQNKTCACGVNHY